MLNDARFGGYDYLEPFVGMGHIVLRRVANKRSYAASDANALVMRLLAAIQLPSRARRCRRSRKSAPPRRARR